MSRRAAALWFILLLIMPCYSLGEDQIIEPVVPVPAPVRLLLEKAAGEVGYREGEHGWSKYGEWAGDPYSQWCAEFLCWCVTKVDEEHGTSLANRQYPIWSSSNVGRAWFIKAGRFIVRTGQVDGWGYEWLKGSDRFIRSGDYIPQPGDYVFFTWTSGTDTDHVAVVEYCTRGDTGEITIHVIEGNNPVGVDRNTYSLTNSQILGFGTVHDLADITMRFGNNGEKVRQLQEKLVTLGYLDPMYVSGNFGNATADALSRFQTEYDLRPLGVANMRTQLKLDEKVEEWVFNNPDLWLVVDEDD